MKSPLRILAYRRVSTEERATEGVSLDAKGVRLEAYCTVKEWHDPEIVTDAGVSAKSLDRPGLNYVLSEVRRKRVDVLLILKLDRLTRTVADLAPLNRQLFTGLHEVCHELFSGSDECFRDLAEDKYGVDVARTLEETLCDEAASILLVPDHVLEEALKQSGYSPQAIFHLSTRAGSRAACLMRVVLSQNAEAWGLILKRDGTIEFSCTNTRFPFRKGYCVEAGHEIHEAWHGALESRALLPFASGSRVVRKPMKAASDGRRIVALFATAFPPKFDPAQTPLFA